MSTQLFLKNKRYKISKRNYTFDYFNHSSKKIDMTLSGKYLSSYENIKIDPKLFDKYPSREDINKLEKEIKKIEKTDREIIIGSGANGILHNIIKMLFLNKGNLVTPYFTFDEAEYAVTSFNGLTKRVYLDNYQINLEKILKSIDRKTKMVYICNPNNPTGIFMDSNKILDFVEKVKVPVVVDESSIDFANKKSILSYNHLPDNLLVIRSFSKAYGIANLRIGYLCCTKKFKDIYIKQNTINEFSGISILIALHQLKNMSNIKKNIDVIKCEKEKIIKKLNEIGIECIKSDSNIIMTKTIFNSAYIDKLNEEDVSVVLVYDEKNNIHLRIAVQDKCTNDKFIKIMSKLNKYKFKEVRNENIFSDKF